MTTAPQGRMPRDPFELDPRLDAFLDRLERLTPEEWGRLDAASAPLRNGIIGRARLMWAYAQIGRIESMHPVLNVLLGLGALAIGSAFMALEPGQEADAAPDPRVKAMGAAIAARHARLEDIQRLAPADSSQRPARTGLWLAFLALLTYRVGRESQREMYQYVEPVIPLDSLVPPPRLLPVEAS